MSVRGFSCWRQVRLETNRPEVGTVCGFSCWTQVGLETDRPEVGTVLLFSSTAGEVLACSSLSGWSKTGAQEVSARGSVSRSPKLVAKVLIWGSVSSWP